MPADPIAEVLTERWWRYRCGEPMPDAVPTRCHRDLNHPSPHVGLPAGDGRYPTWPGVGHTVGVKNRRCWCTLRAEGVHTATWRDPCWPADVEWIGPVPAAVAATPREE